jgi:FtsP/CotA-like multicopper oxidase with cupredoxin domain
VNNQIFNPEEGTSMHWHGFLQKETPWYDGVPSIGQCPIAPGASFTYRFRADSYGSTWYHAHYSAQYSGGILGPLIVHGPKHVDYDFDLGPVMMGDWYHRDYFSVVQDAATTSNDFNVYVPASDNVLINGKNNYNCSLAANGTKCTPNAGLSKFKFHTGKTHRLRLVNAGAAALIRFSIDGHSLKVIANDFVPVVPYETDVVVLGVGQRTDVVVKATGKPKDTYWMRSTVGFNCSRSTAKEALAIIYYDKADKGAKPNSTSHTIPDNHCGNVNTTILYNLDKKEAGF